MSGGFILDAAVAGIFLGAALAQIGLLVVLRRMLFSGMALAQAAACGAALACALHPPFAWWHEWGALLCSWTATLATALWLGRSFESADGYAEARTAFSFTLLWAISLLLLSLSAEGVAEARNLIQGDLLLISRSQLWAIVCTCAVCTIVIRLEWTPLLFCSFDEAAAAAAGLRVRGWNLLFLLVLATLVAVGIKTAGVLLVFCYLVIPPLCAAGASLPPSRAALAAGLFSAAATAGGLWLSLRLDMPASPLIVLLCTFFHPAARLFALWRGKYRARP